MDRNFILEELYRQRKSAIWVLVFQSLLFMLNVGVYIIYIIEENIIGLAIISVVVGLLIPVIVLQCINIWLCTKNITNEKVRQEIFEALTKSGKNMTVELPSEVYYKELENTKDKDKKN
jgi:hypothetical protein